MTTEEEWSQWWGSLSQEDRQKILDLESETGSCLTWNNRYLIVRRRLPEEAWRDTCCDQ